jgi:lipoic acid synthetase
VDCDFLALGQYLRPDKKNTEVKEYLPPRVFEEYRRTALSLGFFHVESAPYVRSSYRADAYLKTATVIDGFSA